MKRLHLIGIALALVSLTACLPSVNPFYTSADVSYDARLVGRWLDKSKSDAPETWEFEQAKDQSYKVTFQDKDGRRGQFSGHLFKLKNGTFLDITPLECKFAPEQADVIAWSVIPGHLLIRITQIEPDLKMAFADYDWLGKQLEKNPAILAHHREEEHLALTASTADLQKFVLQHLAEGELFPKPTQLVRQ